MLQIIRNKTQGFFAWMIILIIAGVFAAWGINDYFFVDGADGAAAKVDGEKISWRTVDTIYERVNREQAGQVDERQLKEQIRLALAQRLALLLATKAQGFRVSDEQVATVFMQIPAFQVEGKFSKEQYLDALARNGYTDASFRQELSQDILLGQLQQGIIQSNLNFPNELNRAVELLDQKRDFGYMMIPVQKYTSTITVSPEEIKNYYEGHKSTFVLPEQVALDYVELSEKDLMKQVKLTETDLKVYYDTHPALYSTPEKVKARHILIPAPRVQEGNPEQDAKAKAKAEEILAKINKGEDFAELAKTESSDSLSAKQGGDLGWFARGEMVPEFEQAVFDLKKPLEIAGPIRTPYGYHLIQLLERKLSEKRPFNDVKNLVDEQFRQEKAQVQFAELNEQLTQSAYENTNLQGISEGLGLKIKTTDLFSKQGGKGIASNPTVLAAAFNEDLLMSGKNSEVIKIDEGTAVVLHLNKHQEAKQQELAEVEKQVQARLAKERAIAKTKETGEQLIEQLKAGDKGSELAKKHALEWIAKSKVSRGTEGIDRQIISLAFQAPYDDATSDKKPALRGSVLPNGDYIALVVTKVTQGDIDEVDDATRNAYKQSLSEINSQLEYGLYTSSILSNAKVVFSEMQQ